MKKSPKDTNKLQAGQAMVEFALGATVFIFMVFATIEAAKYISLDLRVASTVREAARLFVAEEIGPAVYSDSTGYNSNEVNLRAEIQTKVYNSITNMVSPADLTGKGEVIISILRKYDNPTGTSPPLSTSPTPTNTNDDKILIEFQFIYANSNWSSNLGTKFAVVPSSILPTSALSTDERTVAVEIYQKTEFIAPVGSLNWTNFNYVYDKAIY